MRKCIGFLVLALLVLSCQKKTVGTGQLMVVNASPEFGPVSIEIDGKAFSTGEVAYPNNTGYLTLPEGKHLLRTVSGGQTLFDFQFTSAASQAQTLFIFDRADRPQAFAVVDNLTSPGTGKAGFRFFNLSPGFPPVEVENVTGGARTTWFTKRGFEYASIASRNSGFIVVNSGTYDIELRNDPFPATVRINNLQLQEGKNYTLFMKGDGTNPNTPLGYEFITHN